MHEELHNPLHCGVCGHSLEEGAYFYTDEAGHAAGCEWCLTPHVA